VAALHEHPVAYRLCYGTLDEVQNAICGLLSRLPKAGDQPARLMDIGCWDGTTTARYGRTLGNAELHGVEVFDAPARAAEAKGIEVARLDLESEPFPWEDNAFDVVVANQVFEHLKNIWLPLSEAYRVLKPGGHLVISVPNLASLHNRILLAMGRQPTSIRTLGPHVRGYTLGELKHLLEMDGGFVVERTVGVGFYPLPAKLATPVARLWSGGSHTPVVLARKATTHDVPPWEAYRRRETAAGEQTFYG
jgi:SAM-dependent methyltransferase